MKTKKKKLFGKNGDSKERCASKKTNYQEDYMKEGGITLIALVVTIIILLILAGIAIVSVTGDNGLFRKSRETTNIYKDAERDEQGKLTEAENEINKLLNKEEMINFTLTLEITANDKVYTKNYNISMPKTETDLAIYDVPSTLLCDLTDPVEILGFQNFRNLEIYLSLKNGDTTDYPNVDFFGSGSAEYIKNDDHLIACCGTSIFSEENFLQSGFTIK